MTQYFNRLNPAELERLAILSEELGEAQHAIGKILRHGFDSCHPHTGISNRANLELELGHVQNAISMVVNTGDVSPTRIRGHQQQKQVNITKHLHHQD